MPPKIQTSKHVKHRILSRVAPEDFVGRSTEMASLLNFASGDFDMNGLLLLHAPTAGASELLRQTYDELFHLNNGIVPVYFRLNQFDKTTLSVAQKFLSEFLFQVVAYRRRDDSILDSGLALDDLIGFVRSTDIEWIEGLLDSCEMLRARGDTDSLIRLCFNAPQRAANNGIRTLVMFDGFHQVESFNGNLSLSKEIIESCIRGENPFILSGLRRRMLHLVQKAQGSITNYETLRVDKLKKTEAALLVETLAKRNHLQLNDETRDLVVQELEASPYFIKGLLDSARDTETPLDSFRNCQQLYVDAVMGGTIERYYTNLLEEIAPDTNTQHTLIQLIYQAVTDEENDKVSIEVWRKLLRLEPHEFQTVLRDLHANELVSISASQIETPGEETPFGDYMKSRYKLEIVNEPRAMVVAETLLESLKRAPQTMARSYRRTAAVGLRGVLNSFNCQKIPKALFDYERFKHFRGARADEIESALDSETEFIRLPQSVYTTSGAAYYQPFLSVCDEELCAIARCFENGDYIEANEVVWIAAEIDSKLEAGRALTELWVERLKQLADVCGFERYRLWLISNEGFSQDALYLLNQEGVYTSSKQQFDILLERLKPEYAFREKRVVDEGEYELVIPMEDEAELIAAESIENFARRGGFSVEAINQIKTAIVEACINATEHSLSPERKINVKFGFADERLSITISSRGLAVNSLSAVQRINKTSIENNLSEEEATTAKRGWGLSLIYALMDEVSFERVDDGTRLKMTKLLR